MMNPTMIQPQRAQTLVKKRGRRIEDKSKYPPDNHPIYHILFCIHWQIDSHWYDDKEPEPILIGNLTNLAAKQNRREILLISQFNITTDYDLYDIFLQLIGAESNRIDHQVKAMLRNKLLLFFLRNYADRPWNYMWFDFVNKYPLAIGFLQGLNFSAAANLVIVSAEVNDSDVTAKVRALVKRNTALYIVDYRTDLNLNYSSGTFKLEYRYQTG